MRIAGPARRWIAVLALALTGLTGCSGGRPGPTVSAFLTAEPSAAVTLLFEPVTRTIKAHVEGTGFAPKADYQLQIRGGSCLKPTRSLYAFTSFTTRDDGITEAEMKAGPASGIPRGIHLELHLLMSPGSNLTEAVESACTDVPDRTPTKTLRFFPPPTLRRGGSFRATFKDARTLSLRITLVGLRPGSVHAVRVYSGLCAGQGSVDTNVGDIIADESGSATLTKTIRVHADGGHSFIGITSGPSSGVDAAEPKAIDTQLILCGDLPSRPPK